ncbi:MAG: hypothetical protein AAGC53_19345 [Actinomycetota bacterium]
MRGLPIMLVILALLSASCSGDSSDGSPTEPASSGSESSAETTSTTTTPAGPADFCSGVAAVSASLDQISSTMIATMNGEEPGGFILVLDEATTTMERTAELAPDPALADAASLIATTYLGFEELLFEIDFAIETIPVEDPRAQAVADPALAEAVATVSAHCAERSEADA